MYLKLCKARSASNYSLCEGLYQLLCTSVTINGVSLTKLDPALWVQVVSGRQVVVDWALAKARFTDPAVQDAAGEQTDLCCNNAVACCLTPMLPFVF